MKRFFVILLTSVALITACENSDKDGGSTTGTLKTIKVLYWNIQNGMWSDQGNDYNNFVNWVKSYNPDICIWCEAKSNYKTGLKESMPANQCYLPDGWGELAERCGHSYWAKSGQRDNFPQVITSKYPIETLQTIIGNQADSVVSHGAGHYKIQIENKEINFVSLHTWPQKYAFGIDKSQQESSTANNGGDYYRLKEIKYICEHTIAKADDPVNEWWLMAGDFNAQSRLDNDTYNYSDDDTRLLVHDYVLNNTPYKDVIKEKHKYTFKTTTSGTSRIDFVYCSPAMMPNVTYADVISDNWTKNITVDQATNFKHPSDHRPIMLYVRMN